MGFLQRKHRDSLEKEVGNLHSCAIWLVGYWYIITKLYSFIIKAIYYQQNLSAAHGITFAVFVMA